MPPTQSKKFSPHQTPLVTTYKDLTLTGWQCPRGLFLLASRKANEEKELLLLAAMGSSDLEFKEIGKLLLSSLVRAAPIKPLLARSSFSPNEQPFFTQHILRVQNMREAFGDSLSKDIAWKYLSLTSWGEPSAAKVLSEEMNVLVRTIHARLRQARLKGELVATGSGQRLGVMPGKKRTPSGKTSTKKN